MELVHFLFNVCKCRGSRMSIKNMSLTVYVSIDASESCWLYNRFTANTGSYNLIWMRQ